MNCGNLSEPVNQYPRGIDDLWIARYRSEPDGDKPDGIYIKFTGTLEEVAILAQKAAIRNNVVLQSLERRF